MAFDNISFFAFSYYKWAFARADFRVTWVDGGRGGRGRRGLNDGFMEIFLVFVEVEMRERNGFPIIIFDGLIR